MTRPQIFISHSSRLSGARAARIRLEQALEGAGFAPVVDQRTLQLGEEWRKKVFNMTFGCHAAIVLVSKAALDSDYVALEASWLTARRYLDDEFILIPVLLPPVKRADLNRSRLRPLQLTDLQQGTLNDALLKRIVARLNPLKRAMAPSPLDQLVRRIALWLPDRTDLVEDIALHLGVDMSGLNPTQARQCIARALLERDLDALPKTFEALAPNLDRTAAERLLAVLACSWVDPEAIAPIPEVLRRPCAERGVALNGSEGVTAKAYLQRARARFPSWPTLRTINRGGSDQYGRLVREIRRAYGDLHPEQTLSAAEIDARLGLDPGDSPHVVIVPGMIDGEALERLRSHYEHLGYFVLTQDEDPEVVRAELSGVTVLDPPLAPGREHQFLARYEQARNQIAASLP